MSNEEKKYTLEEYIAAGEEVQAEIKKLQDAALRKEPWGVCPGENCDVEFTMYDKQYINYCPQCGTEFQKDE